MNKKSLSIRFILYKTKINQKGEAPLYCRITLEGVRRQFSTGKFVLESHWDSKRQQLIKGGSLEKKNINSELELIIQKFNKIYLELRIQEDNFNISDVWRRYFGDKDKEEFGILEVYNLHSSRLKKLVDTEIKQVTYSKYLESGEHLKVYIRDKFKASDIPIMNMKTNFINDFEYFLKTKRKFKQSTINKIIQRFRRSVRYAVSEGYLNRDPFMLYKSKRVKSKVVFLSNDQLALLESKTFTISRIQKIKDMFVFCCYTGLGFKEMSSLKKSQIVKSFDGNLWIRIHRNKTDRDYSIPLLPQAYKILCMYANEDSGYVFPSISNANFNAYLKEIAAIIKLDFNLTHHVARKTFASTVLLYNNVPMEIVSELLGHSSIKVTQESYAKVVQSRVSEEMVKLQNKLTN
ncbi:tyrosine-type recombinase/integrase [Formosa sp. A9]|uniref:tyrosine-type recombinase/integrase n=1 Tax=Formosa sp. A9 TaxID=3442641 RepID=UPI003EBC847B